MPVTARPPFSEQEIQHFLREGYVILHGFSANRGQSVRFACNPQYSFKDDMNLQRPDGYHSPVEQAIRVGLGWEI